MSASPRVLRILVVDDDDSIRKAIARFLRLDLEAVEVGEAADAASCLQIVEGSKWDLVLLDISLPDRSGLEVLRELRETGHSMPVVVVSALPADQYRRPALGAGATAFIQKERVPEELRDIVSAAVQGPSAAGR